MHFLFSWPAAFPRPKAKGGGEERQRQRKKVEDRLTGQHRTRALTFLLFSLLFFCVQKKLKASLKGEKN